jgi:deferrochelatase/peroxidase EfeB
MVATAKRLFEDLALRYRTTFRAPIEQARLQQIGGHSGMAKANGGGDRLLSLDACRNDRVHHILRTVSHARRNALQGIVQRTPHGGECFTQLTRRAT